VVGQLPADEGRNHRPKAVDANGQTRFFNRIAFAREVQNQEDDDEASEPVDEGAGVENPRFSLEGAERLGYGWDRWQR
jgi:hypothetical protein